QKTVYKTILASRSKTIMSDDPTQIVASNVQKGLLALAFDDPELSDLHFRFDTGAGAEDKVQEAVNDVRFLLLLDRWNYKNGLPRLDDVVDVPTDANTFSSMINGDFSAADPDTSDFGWTINGSASVQNGTGVLDENPRVTSRFGQTFT